MVPEIDPDPTETAGAAVVVGFLVLLLLLLLYRTPDQAIESATVNVQSIVYFVFLPLAGLLGGAYVYSGGSYASVLLFVLGSYLGVFGLALSIGTLLSGTPLQPPLVVGVVLLVLAVLAVGASLVRSFSVVRAVTPALKRE